MKWLNGTTVLLKVPQPSDTVLWCLDCMVEPSTYKANTQRPNIKWYTTQINNASYMIIIDASSGYHNLKLDKKSSYLTIFACKFGRYRFNRLPFGVGPAGDKWKANEIFKGLPNVFDIADGILIVGYNADYRDHDRTLRQVMQVCCQENLNLNKCHFRCWKI